jgi:hypothetical protein
MHTYTAFSGSPDSIHGAFRTGIHGQVRLVCLVRLVRLQTDNIRLQDEQTVNELRKIAWSFRFPFDLCTYSIYMCVYIRISIFIYTHIYIYKYEYIYISI